MSTSSPDRPFTIEPQPFDSSDAREVLERYVAELDRRFPTGFDPGRAVPPAPEDFTPPAGVFLVIRTNGVPAGCGALRSDGAGIGEIRRMWVAPELRGRGAGRALLAALEDQARGLGFRKIRLDTAEVLHEARNLYESAGYREIPAYNDNEYARHWFEKDL